MEIIQIDSEKPEKEKIERAVAAIRNNGLVVYPTETLYGLGADPFSSEAVRKVFEVKGRSYKPISVAVSDLKQAEKVARFNSLALRLAEKFLPGPLTIILPMKADFSGELTLGGRTIGIRIPDHNVAQTLLREVKVLTATSANISGGKNPVTAEEAAEQIGDKVDLILDAGKCRFGKFSTVVDLTEGVKILREGVISKENILHMKTSKDI